MFLLVLIVSVLLAS